MNRYELTTILAEESTPNPATGLIEQAGGTIVNEESLGKRRFAYPINKLTSGAYYRVRFEAEPSMIAGLDAALRHDAMVVRHLIVSQPLEVVAPAPKTEVDEDAIAALGDVKEMTRLANDESKRAEAAEAEAAAKGKPAAVVAKEPALVEEFVIEPAVIDTDKEELASNEVDQETRQADIDKKLKEFLKK